MSLVGTARLPAFEGAPETFTVWELDGKQVGGMMQITDEYFRPRYRRTGACASRLPTATASSRRPAAGATVTNEPMDMPIGRFAGLIDPQGASFTVMQPASAA